MPQRGRRPAPPYRSTPFRTLWLAGSSPPSLNHSIRAWASPVTEQVNSAVPPTPFTAVWGATRTVGEALGANPVGAETLRYQLQHSTPVPGEAARAGANRVSSRAPAELLPDSPPPPACAPGTSDGPQNSWLLESTVTPRRLRRWQHPSPCQQDQHHPSPEQGLRHLSPA